MMSIGARRWAGGTSSSGVTGGSCTSRSNLALAALRAPGKPSSPWSQFVPCCRGGSACRRLSGSCSLELECCSRVVASCIARSQSSSSRTASAHLKPLKNLAAASAPAACALDICFFLPLRPATVSLSAASSTRVRTSVGAPVALHPCDACGRSAPSISPCSSSSRHSEVAASFLTWKRHDHSPSSSRRSRSALREAAPSAPAGATWRETSTPPPPGVRRDETRGASVPSMAAGRRTSGCGCRGTVGLAWQSSHRSKPMQCTHLNQRCEGEGVALHTSHSSRNGSSSTSSSS
mmetsp:Transcript_4303/g.9659  ORF Transcript_4303/g.9659 Transcript_4303/m.9659 type:complete len:292 (-) Transcript_4303:282-1157(-)